MCLLEDIPAGLREGGWGVGGVALVKELCSVRRADVPYKLIVRLRSAGSAVSFC